MKLDPDGLLVRFTLEEGLIAVKKLRAQGFKYRQRTLWSQSWDREMGYWDGEVLILNPSLIHYLDAE